ncbi:hypothetical protein [Thalassobacillus sp. CUG 92003]|uniref:hypothetical protein n=1 Tax=Thalassobacillus sp. CUG 92003 TaxID=2736641 RepID=UPI0015E71720|nr:hypothetical protein [Thalassobacillus sp. CUG 92003]
MFTYHYSMVNWLRLSMMLVCVGLFLIFFFPLASFPSNLFSFIWAFVGIVGASDFVYRIKHDELRIKIRTLLVGVLIGSVLIHFSWLDINPSISELGVVLSPLFLFGDIFTLNRN